VPSSGVPTAHRAGPPLAPPTAEIFEAYPAPTLIVDDDVRILAANRAALELIASDGKTPSGTLGRGGELLRCIHSSGPGGCGRQPLCEECVIRSAVRSAFVNGGVQRAQAELQVERDGKVLLLNALVSASAIHFGEATRVLLTLEDVSDVVRLAREAASSARAVQEAEATLGTVVDNLVEGVVAATVEGNVIHWNPAAVEMHGFSSLEECQRHLPELGKIFDLVDADREPLPLEEWPLSRVLRGDHLHELEVHVHRRDQGWKKIWRYSGSLARDASGAPLLAVITIRDVTQRRALQAQLDVASRLASLGTLVAGVAHEVNNPLAGNLASIGIATDTVRGLLERLDRPGSLDHGAMREDASDLLEILDDARDGAERIARIVRDLTVFGRPDPQQRTVRLREVVDVAMRWLQTTVSPHSKIEVADQGSPEVIGSMGQLEQVLVNLVTNADKAARPGETCRIRIEIGTGLQGQARLVVSDDGVGMSREVLARVFDPFFTTREVGKGMGLGLPICHAIVTAHRGTIVAESEPGKGTTFVVELPCAHPGGQGDGVAGPRR
jgi:PAS domain S-box-containing protein